MYIIFVTCCAIEVHENRKSLIVTGWKLHDSAWLVYIHYQNWTSVSSNTFRKCIISNTEACNHAMIWQSKARTGMITVIVHTFPFDLDAHNTLYEIIVLEIHKTLLRCVSSSKTFCKDIKPNKRQVRTIQFLRTHCTFTVFCVHAYCKCLTVVVNHLY